MSFLTWFELCLLRVDQAPLLHYFSFCFTLNSQILTSPIVYGVPHVYHVYGEPMMAIIERNNKGYTNNHGFVALTPTL